MTPGSQRESPLGEWAKTMLARGCGVRLVPDIHERASALGLVLPAGRKRRARHAAIARAGLLFIHVPKNAGTSISQALYGLQIRHASIRYYLAAAPALVAAVPSVAVIRDPVERFVSAYRYARAGGAADNRIAQAFRGRYVRFASIDDALDHVERAANAYGVDHVFRPQRWYVQDRAGRIAVDRLVPFERIGMLAATTRARDVPHLNPSRGDQPSLTATQLRRLRALYAADFELRQEVERCGETMSSPRPVQLPLAPDPAFAM